MFSLLAASCGGLGLEQRLLVPFVWSAEAQARLEHIPIAFIRGKVKQGLEAYAERQRIYLITPDVMKEALAGEGRPKAFGKMPRL